MTTRTKHWLLCIALSTACMLFLPLLPSETAEHVELVASPLASDEMETLEQLSSWVTDEDRTQELRQAIRDRSEAFELFRSHLGPEANRQRLGHLPYGQEIFETAERYGLDSLLLAALVETESNFRATVVSPMGAVGLTQVLPSTASLMGVREQLTNPHRNLDAGARYLSHLLERFDGDLELTLAAYNAGPGSVDRYDGIPPYQETQRYVEKVLDLYVSHYKEAWQTSAVSELLTVE